MVRPVGLTGTKCRAGQQGRGKTVSGAGDR